MRAQRQFTAAGQTLVIDLPAARVAGLQIVGAFTGTVGLELSLDGGTTWDTVQLQRTDGSAAAASAAVPGVFRSVLAPLPGGNGVKFRARALTLTAGTPTVYLTLG